MECQCLDNKILYEAEISYVEVACGAYFSYSIELKSTVKSLKFDDVIILKPMKT